MSQLTILAFFRAKPGRTQALDTALSALVDPPRAEPECLNYDQSLDDADVWIVHDNWRSAAGLEAHMRSPHLQPILNAMPDLVAGDIVLRRFGMISTPSTLDTSAKVFLQRGLTLAAEWAVQGLVTPHIGRSIDSSLQAINAGLESLKSSAGTLGKIAVTVDPEVGHQEARLP
jgi:quinol monooxygenase YgiN